MPIIGCFGIKNKKFPPDSLATIRIVCSMLRALLPATCFVLICELRYQQDHANGQFSIIPISNQKWAPSDHVLSWHPRMYIPFQIGTLGVHFIVFAAIFCRSIVSFPSLPSGSTRSAHLPNMPSWSRPSAIAPSWSRSLGDTPEHLWLSTVVLVRWVLLRR